MMPLNPHDRWRGKGNLPDAATLRLRECRATPERLASVLTSLCASQDQLAAAAHASSGW